MIFGFLLRVIVWTMPPKSSGALADNLTTHFSLDNTNYTLTNPLPLAVRLSFWKMVGQTGCSDRLVNLNRKFPGNFHMIRAIVWKRMPVLESRSQIYVEKYSFESNNEKASDHENSQAANAVFKGVNDVRNLYPAISAVHLSNSLDLLPERAVLSAGNWQNFLHGAIAGDSQSPLYVFQRVCSTDGAFQNLVSMMFFDKDLRRTSSALLIQFNLDSLGLDLCGVKDLQQPLHYCDGHLTQCKSVPSGMSFQCCCKSDSQICINASTMAQYVNDTEGLEAVCFGATNTILRRVLLCINCVCIVAAVTLIFLVMTQRRIQQFGARGWALMEIFLIGAVLLYTITVVDFLSLRSWSCCAMQWLRELGFSLFYGAIVLKIYRNLIENRVRKAHHVYVKEKDLLKYLILILLTAVTSLVAWTLGGAQVQSREEFPFLTLGTASGLSRPYRICQLQWWGGAWHVYEFLFLVYGLWLCYKARNTAWVERWQFTGAVGIEAFITFSANLIRYYAWYTSNRDAMFLLNFIQTHLTVSLNILLIVVPKFYYIHANHGRTQSVISPNRSSKAHPSLAKLRDNLVNGTIDFAEVPINDMNPEDIRAELKRVYTQLRMYKLKNIYTDNPHISGKRRGKKQSDKQSKRRVSIPSIPLLPKDKSRFKPPSFLPVCQELGFRSLEPGRKFLMAGLWLQCAKRTVAIALPSEISSRALTSESEVDVEEERSSANRSTEDDSLTMTHGAPSVSPTDLTVQSSPHNVYLGIIPRTATAATTQFQLEEDHSVRV